MARLKQLLLPTLLVCILSCKNEQDNIYAIKDFRKSLQPFLFEIVSKGIVTSGGPHIKSFTDHELILLGRSENPILRATAFGEMQHRSSFNHFHVVMNHLDDTAIVATDAGEFGIWFQRVSDYVIQETTWETLEAKNKTVEKVLTKHNYLRSAYTILTRMEAQEKYYPFIKDMATRPRRLSSYGYELYFRDIEYALYGLASFKKPNDVGIIKKRMMQNVWELSDMSFSLMKQFPDTAYLDVLQSYHRRQFYEFSGIRPHGFSGVVADRAAPEDFIGALAVQQNDRSAKLLDTMLTYLPKHTCMPDKENIINEVIMEIWERPCPAYAKLREKIRPKAEEILKTRITLDRIDIPVDTTRKEFRWFN
jgi:hypothetical protein